MAETEGLAAAHEFVITSDGAVVDNAPSGQASGDGDKLAAAQQDRALVRTALEHGLQQIMGWATTIDGELAQVLALATAGEIATAATPDGTETEDGHYRIGLPETPEIARHDDFIYDSEDPTAGDYVARTKWKGKLRAAQLARPDLVDATDFYAHYWSNSGEPREFDYEKAYAEDAGIRGGVDAEIARAQAAAEELIAAGHTDFPMTGQASTVENQYYPETENWQKAVGGYQIWSSANVRVDGNTVTMEITVNGEDRYNFNRGQSDIATGAPDDENGRFTEIGWAQPFDTHGELTRTVTWELGDAGGADVVAPDGGEDDGRWR